MYQLPIPLHKLQMVRTYESDMYVIFSSFFFRGSATFCIWDNRILVKERLCVMVLEFIYLSLVDLNSFLFIFLVCSVLFRHCCKTLKPIITAHMTTKSTLKHLLYTRSRTRIKILIIFVLNKGWFHIQTKDTEIHINIKFILFKLDRWYTIHCSKPSNQILWQEHWQNWSTWSNRGNEIFCGAFL